MSVRVMAKVFDVEPAEKGSPLQSKINAFTKGKNITDVHAFTSVKNGNIGAVLIYSIEEAEEAPASPRIFSKVVSDVAISSELQTKINAFSKDKALDVKGAAVVPASDGKTATVVLLYTKEGDDDSGE